MADDLRTHMEALTAPRPTGRWRRRTLELLEDTVARYYVLRQVRWYATKEPRRSQDVLAGDAARGHVWAAALTGGPAMIPLLDVIARRAAWVTRDFQWDPRLANATIRALGEFADPMALEVLRQLRRDVRYPGGRKQADLAIEAAAGRQGITPAQLEERGVPAHGLDRDGSLEREVGGYRAVLTIEDPVTVLLTFTGAGGRPRRTVPAELKESFSGEIRELRALAKGVRATLSAERARIEGLMPAEREWAYAEWAQYYRDHPITGVVTRALIWEFQTPDGTWEAALPGDGALMTVGGKAMPAPSGDVRVRLWHPVKAPVDEVRAWREFVMDNQLRQAFKQAFREIYLLTPAEEETGLHSNRFAAHIVRYQQLYALFKQRGWKSNYPGPDDGGFHGNARRVLADGQWRACFFHEPADDEMRDPPAYASTDQVRFERRNGRRWRETPPADVPQLVFSEAMRDVDLFVDVTSIAADPEWAGRGEDRYTAYWWTATFGDLTASAEIRRAALERILPRTKIAGRCSLAGRFLVVRGELRTYKIHLGSANILMEPDDAYLCIVAGRGKSAGKVFLPFEDERLALILSKAFLLAADTGITDESILIQLKRGA